MTSTTVYFVTGASRGIGTLDDELCTLMSSSFHPGFALVAELAANVQNAFTYAGVRNLTQAVNLQKLASGYPGKITLVQYVAGDVAGNRTIAEIIKSKHGVVDIVVGSAGISAYMGPVSETPLRAFRDHFEVNVIGMVVLFQTMLDLLKASSDPKFIPISSVAGSITTFIDLPLQYACYGSSKAALNYVSRKIHFENDWLTCVPIAPGVVRTDVAEYYVSLLIAIANRAMDESGLLASLQDQAFISPEECATALVRLIEGATREKDGGEFMNIDGTKISW
ncbi:hypothetical protein GYMLUDRAFT_89045 [Collybiopsis luxurians FD-317 M1]|uniref:Uncharacterized protein n=1 Tax=Collybiopsis luxurians FD-317 M1 TaxID=944289 RepID=A0A0D0BPB4_9AGAR|nr:hypothetical protein GYMLUDRAFT_89045 [Collybiopsis luxurians FD-317 M1]